MGYYNKSKNADDLIPYIKKHFFYNPDTGVITRDDMKGGNGSFDKDGYLILKIKSRQFKAHRIAWLLFYGYFPKMEIDHINGIKTDNRISNLRDVDRATNVNNTPHAPNPLTGVVWVYFDTVTKGLKKRFTTRINNKMYRFYTLEQAIKFRLNNGKRIS